MIFYIILSFNETHSGTNQIGTGKNIQYRSAITKRFKRKHVQSYYFLDNKQLMIWK